MKDKGSFFIGYICIFIAVFLFSLVYPMIPTFINYSGGNGFSLPQSSYTISANNTSGIQMISNNYGILGTVIITLIIVSISFATFGGRSMSRGM